jgi:hypothetical protein
LEAALILTGLLFSGLLLSLFVFWERRKRLRLFGKGNRF